MTQLLSYRSGWRAAPGLRRAVRAVDGDAAETARGDAAQATQRRAVHAHRYAAAAKSGKSVTAIAADRRAKGGKGIAAETAETTATRAARTVRDDGRIQRHGADDDVRR